MCTSIVRSLLAHGIEDDTAWLDVSAVQSDAKQMESLKNLLQSEDIGGSVPCVSKTL